MTLQQQSNKNHFRKHFYDFFEYLLSWYVYLMDIGIHIFQQNLISLKMNSVVQRILPWGSPTNIYLNQDIFFFVGSQNQRTNKISVLSHTQSAILWYFCIIEFRLGWLFIFCCIIYPSQFFFFLVLIFWP